MIWELKKGSIPFGCSPHFCSSFKSADCSLDVLNSFWLHRNNPRSHEINDHKKEANRDLFEKYLHNKTNAHLKTDDFYQLFEPP